MKRKPIFIAALLLLLTFATVTILAQDEGTTSTQTIETSIGTAFYYQGVMKDNDNLANGEYDFRFTLYGLSGSQVGTPFVAEDIPVENGLFALILDFGPEIFDGAFRLIEVEVRPGSSTGAFELLSPRHPLYPIPYAMHAAAASALEVPGNRPDDAVFVDIDGNLGIRDPSPTYGLSLVSLAGADNSAALEIRNVDFGGAGACIFHTSGGNMEIRSRCTTMPGGEIYFFNNTSMGQERLIMVMKGDSVGIGTDTVPNVLTIAQGLGSAIADGWSIYSSARWKENITPIDGAMDTLTQLEGVTFDWAETGEADIGLIAEDVGQVMPNLVEYEENGVDARAVDYARLVPLLIEATKEQQSTIDNLTAENEALRGEIAEIRQLLEGASDSNRAELPISSVLWGALIIAGAAVVLRRQ